MGGLLSLGIMSSGHTDFARDDIEPDLREHVEALVMHKLKLALYKIGDWIHGKGRPRPGGVEIRAYVAFWDVLPYLRNLSQTQLATLMGRKHKQSVGAEVSSFRDEFDWFNPHMQSEKAREKCRKRELRKKAAAEVVATSSI